MTCLKKNEQLIEKVYLNIAEIKSLRVEMVTDEYILIISHQYTNIIDIELFAYWSSVLVFPSHDWSVPLALRLW